MRRYVGERVPRREDHRFITGHGAYLDNLRVPEALHAALVR
jgi:carbon-monoxide dehydrogenase large subunit